MTAPAERPSGRFRAGLALISALGFLGRLAYLFGSGIDHTSVIHQGDAFWYSSVAWATAKGEVFTNPFFGIPTADHPPMTVVLLAPVGWLFPNDTIALRLAMVVLGTATIVVLGLTGRRLGGPRVGLAAAAFGALLPALWINDVLIMSETPTALAVAVILYLGIVLPERPTVGLAAAAGVACGVAALTRAETGLFLPLLMWPILALARDLDVRQRAGRIAAATAATALVMAPWTIYNLTRFDEPVPISTNDGLTLLGANCHETYHGEIVGGWLIQPCIQEFWDTMDDRKAPGPSRFPADHPCADTSQHRPPCWDASTVSKLMRADGADYLRGHLSDLPRVIYARNGRVWGWYRLDQSIGTGVFEGRITWVTRLGYVAAWVMIPTSIVGAVLLRRRRVSLLPFGSSLLIVVVVSSAFYGLVRFRIPWDVASCLLCAVAVAALSDRWWPTPAPEPENVGAEPPAPGSPSG